VPMPVRSIFLLAALLLTVLGSENCLAQTNPAARPRIGLVLSGGGARGAAHVGVLKVLDELRIPIDAIAGTSMGAVVGGLYASGMSATEIERQFASVDWQDAFRDRPQRLALGFRRRLEDREFLVQLPLGLRGGSFQLPKGLIQGQKLTQILRKLTLPAYQVTDFDLLPTAFRAVATDLESGEAVILRSGDLATAVRASVSAPGIFSPVERDGRLLVDGGISQNLPIDVARAMGVDVLIVVDVGFPLSKREQLNSVASVSNQMLAILIRRNSDQQRSTLGPGDILLDPALGKASSFDFGHLKQLMAAGEDAARKSIAQLASLSVSEDQYAHYLAHRQIGSIQPAVAFVRADGASAQYESAVQILFGGLVGVPINADELGRKVNRLYGQGGLELLDYRLEPESKAAGDSAYGLTFSARRNSWGPNYVKFGLRLQDDFAGNSSFDAAARVVVTELSHAGAEWVWDGQLGGNPLLATELYLPFSQMQRWFVAPKALLQIRNVPEFVDEKQVGSLRVRSLRYGVDIGRAIGNAAEIRAGFAREIGSSTVRLGPAQPRQDFRTREYFTRYSLDKFDNVAFPRRGESFSVEWRGQLADELRNKVSDSLRADWRLARTWGRNTGLAWVSGGSLLDSQFADVRTYFPLGGFLNLSGLPTDALSGPNYGIARFIYYRKVGSGGDGFLNVPLYAGMSLEVGNTWQSRKDVNFGALRKDASLFFGMDTFLGPAYFSMGYDSVGRSAFYLSLGRGL
jgi:NTE family protein